jgi:hypothetical protein
MIRMKKIIPVKKRKRLLLVPVAAAAIALIAFTVTAATASTTPKWYVGGNELTVNESYGGVSEPSSMSAAGVTTKCEHSYYVATIFNSGGLGKGELTSLPLYECSANAGCTLSKLEPKKLPWPMHTVFEGTKPYLVIEGVTLEAVYSGFFCVLSGTHEVTGSVGGLLENSTQKVVFNSSSASATGASLKTGFLSVEFNGSFTAEDVGPNYRGQLVEAK